MKSSAKNSVSDEVYPKNHFGNALGVYAGGADLLVRSQHNRRKTGEGEAEQGSWQHVESLPMAVRIKISVPRSAGVDYGGDRQR